MNESRSSTAASAVLVSKDSRRLFSHKQREAIYLAANGRCEQCGTQLEEGWHADHVVPHSKGGPTEITNGAALCSGCNLRKSNKTSSRSAIQKQLALQADEIERLKSLPELWGPQCMHIDALLGTASRLTRRQRVQLEASYLDVFEPQWGQSQIEWDQALDATYDVWACAGRKPHIEAAEDSFYDIFTKSPVPSAGLYALRALVLRDLIGQYGYCQRHYDTHTRPWANVIGPVHPRDFEVAR
jgi:hypothetical protein